MVVKVRQRVADTSVRKLSVESPASVLKSPTGKFLRAIASVFIATSGVAIWTAAKMAQVVTEAVRVSSLHWIQKVGTGQSQLFNPNPALDTVSDFFGSIGQKAIDAGLFGMKQTAQLLEDSIGETLTHSGLAKTTDGGNVDDLEDILSVKNKLAQHARDLREARIKQVKEKAEYQFLQDYLPNADEWAAKMQEIINSREETKNDPTLNEATRKLRLGEHSLDMISHMLSVDPLTKSYAEHHAKKMKEETPIEEIAREEFAKLFDIGPDGQEVMKAGVTAEDILRVMEKLESKIIPPSQSPRFPEGSELGHTQGRQVP